MSPALNAAPPARDRRWIHYVDDDFFDHPDLELDPLLERLLFRFERSARDRPWCDPTNDELMRQLGCTHNTLAGVLARGEAQGWFRRVLIPGRHGRATGRLGFVLLRRPTGRPVATDATYDQIVARMTAEIGRKYYHPSTIPFRAEAPPPTVGGPHPSGTAVPNGWVPSVPSGWVPASNKEEVTGGMKKTTTTGGDNIRATGDIHASSESSSSFAALSSEPGFELVPSPATEAVLPVSTTAIPMTHATIHPVEPVTTASLPAMVPSLPAAEVVLPVPATAIPTIHATIHPVEPVEPVTTAPTPAAVPSLPAASSVVGPELAEAVRQAEKLFGPGMLGRIRAVVLAYTLEWVLAALFVAAGRPGRKSCNLPVVSWGYVLNTLKNWKQEGGPSPKVLDAMRTARGPCGEQAAPAPPARTKAPVAEGPEAAERAREARLRVAWEGLAESEREAIRATVKAENPGVSRWPNMFEPLCLAAVEVRMAGP